MLTLASSGSRRALGILGPYIHTDPSLPSFQSTAGCWGAEFCAAKTAMPLFPHWELAGHRISDTLCHLASRQSLSNIWWPVIISHPRTLRLRVTSHVTWKPRFAMISLEKSLDPEVIGRGSCHTGFVKSTVMV